MAPENDRVRVQKCRMSPLFPLRSSELRALTRGNFELDGPEPFVWLLGDHTKNRKGTELPLRPATAGELRGFLGSKHRKASVFPNMPPNTDMAHMMRFDLNAAGIPFETDSGRMDFHGLRVTCLSWLADAGTPLRTLQEFARHSTPTLTMNVYARTLRGSLADAAARLPDLGRPAREAAQATGSYNARPLGGTESDRDIAPQIAPNAAHAGATPSKSVPASAGVPSSGAVLGNPTEIGGNERTVAHQSAREWMGIEPTRGRTYDPSTALKAAGPTRRPDTPGEDLRSLYHGWPWDQLPGGTIRKRAVRLVS